MKNLGISLRFLLVFTLLLGLAYPLFVTLVAQTAFPSQANGSLVLLGDRLQGSLLIGQDFSGKKGYFQGRLSASGERPYNPLASGGSNLSPWGQTFRDRVAASQKTWADRARQAGVTTPVPQDLVTASASGLDPHLDLTAALWQVPLVAQDRQKNPQDIKALVERHGVKPLFPWDPAAYVNVGELNRDLDQSFPPAP